MFGFKRMDRQVAIALGYELDRDLAPKVVAKGYDEIARKIVELAQSYNIPVRKDADLIELLESLSVGSAIPTEAYEVVAEILAFVYLMNERLEKPSPR